MMIVSAARTKPNSDPCNPRRAPKITPASVDNKLKNSGTNGARYSQASKEPMMKLHSTHGLSIHEAAGCFAGSVGSLSFSL